MGKRSDNFYRSGSYSNLAKEHGSRSEQSWLRKIQNHFLIDPISNRLIRLQNAMILFGLFNIFLNQEGSDWIIFFELRILKYALIWCSETFWPFQNIHFEHFFLYWGTLPGTPYLPTVRHFLLRTSHSVRRVWFDHSTQIVSIHPKLNFFRSK